MNMPFFRSACNAILPKSIPGFLTILLFFAVRYALAGETEALDPDNRCIEACALIQQIAPDGRPSAWNALESFSNAPNETLELFSPNGASLYIKGEALPLSAALLNKNPAAIRLYSQLQVTPAGHGRFFTWNDDGCSINRTDISWLRCSDHPDTPIINISVTELYQNDSSNRMHGAWAGAYTDQQETGAGIPPEKQAGQMNALFILDGTSLFFRFSDNRQKQHGVGIMQGNHLVGHGTNPDDSGFFFFDAALDPTNQALRGTAFSAQGQTIITRRFFLKKELP